MIQIHSKIYSFEEYLTYHDGTDTQYELFKGELIPMPPASGIQALSRVFLYDTFKAEIQRIGLKCSVITNSIGIRTGEKKCRIPDLVILSEIQRQSLRTMSSAVLESPSLLAVEIVSEGNPQDDYRYKRSEYAVREIPEYWIVDPIKSKVSVLLLVEGFYEITEFTGNQVILSQTLPELRLTAEQVLAG